MRRGTFPVLAGLAVSLVAAGAAAFGASLDPSAGAETALAAADIPAPYAAAYQAAARSVTPALPWEILAAVGREATDHGRRSPYDSIDRDQPPATTFPVTAPPISGAGQGPLLLTPAADSPPGADLQDIRVAAEVLARAAAPVEERTWQGLGLSADVVGEPLDDPSAERFWAAVLNQLPVAVGIGGGPSLTAGSSATHESAAAGPAGPPAVESSATAGGDPMARFASDLLANLGDAATPAAVAGIQAWASGEGSRAAFNPLDTTEDEPGATAYNSNGGDPVRNYPSYQTGLAATVATFAPGGRPAPAYAAVLAALHAGQSTAAIEAAVAASPWGTRSFPNPSFTALANFPGFPGSVPTGPATIVGPVAPQPVASDPAPAPTASGALAVAQAYAGVTVSSPSSPALSPPGAERPDAGGPAAVAVAFALAQLGKPYQLGATGPGAYDCSGLVQAAYRAAGIALPRTTYQQVAAGQPVPLGDPSALQPGDLVFIMGADPEGGLPGHVGMVVSPGDVIDAPYTGAVVRVTPLSTWTGQLVAVRRIVGGTG